MTWHRRSVVDDISERLRNSDRRDFRKSVFLGFQDGAAGNAVLIPDELLVNGLLILGGMRSGKSACITSLGAQHIRRNDGPVVTVDLKGDDETRHTFSREAKEAGRPFWDFTNVLNFATRLFNPLDQKHLVGLTQTQVSEVVATSMNLQHGSGYGRFHFTAQTLGGLADAIAASGGNGWMPSQRKNRVRNFVELGQRIREVVKRRKELGGADSLQMVVAMLADVAALNGVKGLKWFPDSSVDAGIQVWDILMPNQDGKYPVVYFYLRAESQPTIASIIAKLFLNLLKNALRQFRDAYKQGTIEHAPPEVLVFIDECQYVLDDSLRNMLEQGASMGFRFILANQDLSQLNRADRDFSRTVFENVGNKIILTARDCQLQDVLMKLSGEKELHRLSYEIDGWDLSLGNTGSEYSVDGCYHVRTETGPRFERNHLIELSDNAGRAAFIPAQSTSVARYDGYPIIVDIPFLHTEKEYKVIQGLPWPSKTEDTIVSAEFQPEWEDYVFQQRISK